MGRSLGSLGFHDVPGTELKVLCMFFHSALGGML